MGIMYLAFFNASVGLSALTTLAYFLFTYQQYRTANDAREQPRRRGSRGRSQLAFASANPTSPIASFLHTLSGYIVHQSAVANLEVRRGADHAHGAVAAVDRDFEVADPALPVSLEALAIGRLGSILMWLLAFSLTMVMIMRTVITHHAPWTNMYEASIALAGFLVMAYLWFELRFHSRSLGVGAAGISLLLLISAIWVGNAFNQAEPVAFKAIMPALQDNPILTIHVSMMIVSYAFFIVGFVCGVLMLMQGFNAKPRYAWLPTADAVDELGYRAVTIGFPVLAVGIILGAWWANYAWGHYWSWDPKETSALITWLVYAIYLHARGLRGLRGKAMAWLLIAGFAATLFTYFGVSFIIPGLHSYAGVK